MATVYVALLDEGIDVWRPVEARAVGEDIYELSGSVPSEERWAFQPGDLVACEPHTFAGGEQGLVAVRRIPGR